MGGPATAPPALPYPPSKRALDVVVSALLLVAAAPLGAAAALAVAVGGLVRPRDRGPLLHQEVRVSAGRTFVLRKFRILTREAEARIVDGEVPKVVENTPGALTAVGRALKRTGLDELPQLLGVLGGSMAMVGPRPKPVPEYEAALEAGETWRAELRAGLTGPVQAMKGTGSTLEQQREADRAYADIVRSGRGVVAADVRLLAATVRTLLRFSGE